MVLLTKWTKDHDKRHFRSGSGHNRRGADFAPWIQLRTLSEL